MKYHYSSDVLMFLLQIFALRALYDALAKTAHQVAIVRR